jgi:hypothetical protein
MAKKTREPMGQNKELDSEIKRTERIERVLGWANYIFANFVSTLAIAGSITASFLVAFGFYPKWITAVCAAIPAAVFAFNKIYNFEHRALYHWRKANKLRILLCKLWYEGAEVNEVSIEYRETILKTLDEWIMFSVAETAVRAKQEALTERSRAKMRKVNQEKQGNESLQQTQ